ncbi:MAG TPA: TlpA disulfide reductase family protein [Steroidobacteraceae bacterium]|nr:TlpA disulfide reductase family protein [Steroidobacteraceae bacterium]
MRVAKLFPRRSRRISLVTGLFIAALVSAGARASDLDLDAYRGKVVYIDFWASWCAPCRESFPWLDQLERQFGAQNLVVIGVNVDHDRDSAERFLNQNFASFPIVYDPLGKIASAYQVKGMPSAVLIDRAGQVRFEHIGFSSKKTGEYEDQLQILLNERPSESSR